MKAMVPWPNRASSRRSLSMNRIVRLCERSEPNTEVLKGRNISARGEGWPSARTAAPGTKSADSFPLPIRWGERGRRPGEGNPGSCSQCVRLSEWSLSMNLYRGLNRSLCPSAQLVAVRQNSICNFQFLIPNLQSSPSSSLTGSCPQRVRETGRSLSVSLGPLVLSLAPCLRGFSFMVSTPRSQLMEPLS
jgi:hypothetical protein